VTIAKEEQHMKTLLRPRLLMLAALATAMAGGGASAQELPRTPEARAACARYTPAVAKLLVQIDEQDPMSLLADIIAGSAGYRLRDSDYQAEDVNGADVGDNIEFKCVVKFKARREVNANPILGIVLSSVPIIQDYSVKRANGGGVTVAIGYLGSIMTGRIALSRAYSMDVRP
jgi:hypothetical protein